MLLDLDQLIEKYKMDIRGVIHAGGHHGQEIPMYKKLGLQREQVIVFEPVPQTFKILESNCNDDATLVNLALGNECKKVTIYTEEANQGQSSSILEAGLHKIQYPHIVFNGKVEVDMVTLDSWMDKVEDRKRFNFLMADIQGAELMLLQGATETLKYIDYIMLEINRAEVYIGCPMVEELDAFLATYGFKRVEDSWAGGTWGDGFYRLISV